MLLSINGKINGTYRFDVSEEKGVRANFYSRKGKKYELIRNVPLLENANKLLLNKTKDDEMIVYNFATSVQHSIFYNYDSRKIRFDDSDFNTESILEAEERISSILSNLKGEIPLRGLIDRIGLYQEIVKKRNNDKQKVLRLENIIDE